MHVTEQNVGVLSKIDASIEIVRGGETRVKWPVPNSKCKKKYPPKNNASGTMSISKHYLTQFKVSEKFKLNFVGAHLLAQPSNIIRCFKREAQAEALKQHISNVFSDDSSKNAEIIILGDFNDFDNETPGADQSKSISNTLKILKSSHPSKQEELINILSNLTPQSERYSAWHDINSDCKDTGNSKEHSLLDHVLASKRLVDDHLEKIQILYHKEERPSCSDRVSDHWPVVIDFQHL